MKRILLPPSENEPCLCTICECGKHHCPGVMRMEPLGASSSYREHFPPKVAEPSPPRASPQRRLEHTPSRAPAGHFLTTKQEAEQRARDLTPPRGASTGPPPPTRPPALGPSQKFEGSSTAKAHYVAPPRGAYTLPAPPSAVPPTTVRFEGASVHRTDYVPHHLESPPAFGKDTRPVPGQRVPFSGSSTSHDHYVAPAHPPQALEGSPSQSRHPPPALPRQPFNGETTHKAHFVAPLVPREVGAPPRRLPEKVPGAVRFEGESHYASVFVPKTTELPSVQRFPRVALNVFPPRRDDPQNDLLSTSHAVFSPPQVQRSPQELCPAARFMRLPPGSDGHIKVQQASHAATA